MNAITSERIADAFAAIGYDCGRMTLKLSRDKTEAFSDCFDVYDHSGKSYTVETLEAILFSNNVVCSATIDGSAIQFDLNGYCFEEAFA